MALLCSTGAMFAQTSGTISGLVVDLSGDPVADAPIQLTNLSTNVVFKTTSVKSGQYSLAQLPTGSYKLSVAAPGFDAFLQPSLTVAAAQTLRFDIHLSDYQLGTLGDGREFRIQLTSPHPTPPGPTPRTADGKPDFSGVWYAQRTIDPGMPVMLPWAETLVKERAASNFKDAPGAHCLTRGITSAGALFPYKVIQTPKLLLMIFEDDTPSHRQVFLDGRGHPKDPNPAWMGHSVGHWEGDTLVVDTVGFNDRTWLDAQGHPHTEMMRVTERFHRPEYGHLEIEFTIDDPGTYAKPWVIKRVADIDPNDEVGEYVCEDRDVKHMVGK